MQTVYSMYGIVEQTRQHYWVQRYISIFFSRKPLIKPFNYGSTQKGHIGTNALFKRFTERNPRVTWQEIKTLQGCIMCKQMIDRYGYTAPIDTYKPTTFNFIIQIDFIGLLKSQLSTEACHHQGIHIHSIKGSHGCIEVLSPCNHKSSRIMGSSLWSTNNNRK